MAKVLVCCLLFSVIPNTILGSNHLKGAFDINSDYTTNLNKKHAVFMESCYNFFKSVDWNTVVDRDVFLIKKGPGDVVEELRVDINKQFVLDSKRTFLIFPTKLKSRPDFVHILGTVMMKFLTSLSPSMKIVTADIAQTIRRTDVAHPNDAFRGVKHKEDTEDIRLMLSQLSVLPKLKKDYVNWLFSIIHIAYSKHPKFNENLSEVAKVVERDVFSQGSGYYAPSAKMTTQQTADDNGYPGLTFLLNYWIDTIEAIDKGEKIGLIFQMKDFLSQEPVNKKPRYM